MIPCHSYRSTALPYKPFSLQTFRRYVCDQAPPSTPGTPKDAETPLSLRELKRQIQRLLEEERETSLIVETGDSWFIGQSMRLPAGTSQSNIHSPSQMHQSKIDSLPPPLPPLNLLLPPPSFFSSSSSLQAPDITSKCSTGASGGPLGLRWGWRLHAR